MNNPILEELWRVRAQVEAEYGGDLDKYSEDLEEEFQTGKPRIVVVSDAIRKRAEKAMKPKYDKMPSNPVIDEIRAIRAKIMREFGYDMDKYCDYLEEKYRHLPHVELEPKRIGNSKKRISRTVKAKALNSNGVAKKSGRTKKSA